MMEEALADGKNSLKSFNCMYFKFILKWVKLLLYLCFKGLMCFKININIFEIILQGCNGGCNSRQLKVYC